MNNPASQREHDSLVRNVARQLEKRFYQDIRAAVSEYPKPDRVPTNGGNSGVAPDVTVAARNGCRHLFEVETRGSIKTPVAAEKWAAFARYAGQYCVDFWIVVPKGTRQPVQEKLSDLRIRAKVWEV